MKFYSFCSTYLIEQDITLAIMVSSIAAFHSAGWTCQVLACGSGISQSLPTCSRQLSPFLSGRNSSWTRFVSSHKRPSPILQRQGEGLQISSKMIVPGFGEKSPEVKAADSLHNFFTYLAVKIVLHQLEAYNPEAYHELMEFTDRTPLKDGDQFCALLMREGPRQKALAMRIMEVRSAYILEDFEWESLKDVSSKRMKKGNTQLMLDFLVETTKLD